MKRPVVQGTGIPGGAPRGEADHSSWFQPAFDFVEGLDVRVPEASWKVNITRFAMRLKGFKVHCFLLLLLGVFGAVAFRPDVMAADLSLNDRSGEAGSIVSFLVRVNNAPNEVGSLGFEVRYDWQTLKYQGYSPGSLVSGFDFFDANNALPGIVRIGGFAAQVGKISEGESGDLVSLTFRVAGHEDCSLRLAQLKDDIRTWSIDGGHFKGDHRFEERTEKPLTENNTEMKGGSVSSEPQTGQSGNVSRPGNSPRGHHPREDVSGQGPLPMEGRGTGTIREAVPPARQRKETRASRDAGSTQRARTTRTKQTRNAPISLADTRRQKPAPPSGTLSVENNKEKHTLTPGGGEYMRGDTNSPVWWTLIGVMLLFGAMYYTAIGLFILFAGCLAWEVSGIGSIIHQGIRGASFLNRRGVIG